MVDEKGLSVEFVSRMIGDKTSLVTRLDRPRGGEILLFKADKGKIANTSNCMAGG
jgi:hypothetical protein